VLHENHSCSKNEKQKLGKNLVMALICSLGVAFDLLFSWG
jgi:hypothetical protein